MYTVIKAPVTLSKVRLTSSGKIQHVFAYQEMSPYVANIIQAAIRILKRQIKTQALANYRLLEKYGIPRMYPQVVTQLHRPYTYFFILHLPQLVINSYRRNFLENM